MQVTLTRSLALSFVLAVSGAAAAQEATDASHSDLVQSGRMALQASDWKAAAKSFQKAVEINPEDGTSWQLLGYSLHAMQKLDEALPIHKKAAEFAEVAPVASYNVACVYALKGENELALKWLEKAAAKGFARPDHIANDPDMDPLRDDERFKAVVKKISKNAGGASTGMQVFQITTPRESARVAWFTRNGSPGQIAIDYTPVKWQEKYDAMVGSEKMMGRKWRLGADFWTSLDTSVDLVMGGTKVPAGYYYLTLEQREGGSFILGVHDANKIKKQRLDAFQANQVKGGIEVELKHHEADSVQDTLKMAILTKSGSQTEGKFKLHFGGHALTAPVEMHVGGKPAADASAEKKHAKKAKY